MVRPGDTFTAVARKGDETWELEGVSTSLIDGDIGFSATLKHNDAIIARPRLVAHEGEAISFQVDEDGKFVNGVTDGFKLDLTLKRVDDKSRTSAHTKAAEIGSASGDSKPSENTTYRKMKPPRYPPASVRARVQGDVTVNVQFDERGVPFFAEVYGIEPSSAVELGGAAVVAALQWRYNPGVRDGRAVGGALLVPVTFHLGSEDGASIAPADPMRPLTLSYRKLIPPVYPAHAIVNKISGKVFARIEVGTDGLVVTARIEKTVPGSAAELGEAALEVIKTWQFSPPRTINGHMQASEARIPIEFKLDEMSATAAAGIQSLESPLPPVANTLQTIVVIAPSSF